MKTKTVFSFVLTLISLFSLSEAANHHPLKKIKCSISPIDRAKIHPSGDQATSDFIRSSASQNTTSTNWSGYVAAKNFLGKAPKGTVSDVAGSWTVPTLEATTDASYCAIWVGIDGYMSDSVEQIGTSHNWSDGAQQNYAWFEMYPKGSFQINDFPVDNGDVISAEVSYKGYGRFKMTIANITKGVTTVIPMSSTRNVHAKRSSAEWVVEAPYSGEILPLADFQSVTLTNCSAIIGGVAGTISNGKWMNDEITMESGSGVEAQPSALFNNGSGFQVAWKSE